MWCVTVIHKNVIRQIRSFFFCRFSETDAALLLEYLESDGVDVTTENTHVELRVRDVNPWPERWRLRSTSLHFLFCFFVSPLFLSLSFSSLSSSSSTTHLQTAILWTNHPTSTVGPGQLDKMSSHEVSKREKQRRLTTPFACRLMAIHATLPLSTSSALSHYRKNNNNSNNPTVNRNETI